MTVIRYQKGDIFDSKAHVIVNTVNCKGVMGKGLALAFKQRYPAMFTVYQQECKKGKLRIGKPTLYRASTPWILNFPTKDDWRLPSKLEYLEKGLEYVVANYKDEGIKSIAFPKLGAQNGKLSWDDVGPLMARCLSQLDIDVYIYIVEGDKEYQSDIPGNCDTQEGIWKQFNVLALDTDRLCQEVGLSLRQAKKVADKAPLMEFKSPADIENIEGIAKKARQSIKNYINQQLYAMNELPNMASASSSQPVKVKDGTGQFKRKKRNIAREVFAEPLFPERTPVS